MPCWKGKKYQLVQSVNFDQVMKELGVGMTLRTMGNTLDPIVELMTADNVKYTLNIATPYRRSSITFELGKEFIEETLDGREVCTTVTLDGNFLKQEQKGEKDTVICREFFNEELVTTINVRGIKAVRLYRAIREEQEENEEVSSGQIKVKQSRPTQTT